MSVKIAVLRERRPGERRVAAVPDSVKRFIKDGCSVAVETGAGLGSGFDDAAYEAEGATIARDAAAAVDGAEILLKVRRPLRAGEGDVDEMALLRPGMTLVALLSPYGDDSGVQDYAKAGVTAFAMELLPRISRAQSMDVLSSQNNLAGYRAVVDAAAHFDRAFPMMMTSAGTIAPAKVFVIGAGVAGLQAIATARRLGAIVSATDVRPATRDQVQSLGAKFVFVEDAETEQAETAAGYAKEMSEDYQRRQAELVASTVAKQDIVITTALIPGRPAPRLVSTEMVESMRRGSIVYDLAAENGGNCELTKAGEIVDHNGVKIIGAIDVASQLSSDTSAFFARNLYNFLAPHLDKEGGTLQLNWQDETIAGAGLTQNGKIVHPNFVKEG